MLTVTPKQSAVRRAMAPVEGRILVGAQQVVDSWFRADNRGPIHSGRQPGDRAAVARDRTGRSPAPRLYSGG